MIQTETVYSIPHLSGNRFIKSPSGCVVQKKRNIRERALLLHNVTKIELPIRN